MCQKKNNIYRIYAFINAFLVNFFGVLFKNVFFWKENKFLKGQIIPVIYTPCDIYLKISSKSCGKSHMIPQAFIIEAIIHTIYHSFCFYTILTMHCKPSLFFLFQQITFFMFIWIRSSARKQLVATKKNRAISKTKRKKREKDASKLRNFCFIKPETTNFFSSHFVQSN